MRFNVALWGVVLAISMAVVSVSAQQPDIVNGKLDTQQASAGLPAAIAAVTRSDAAPSWIAYELPAVAEREGDGRRNQGWGSCSADLEEGANYTNGSGRDASRQRHILIFLRAERQHIERVRMFEENCRVDADGMTVHWLSGVRPADSVNVLSAYVQNGQEGDFDHTKEAALAAIASTDDPSADSAMRQFTSAASPHELRRQAIFWLGAARGRKGYEMLRDLVKSEPDDDLRDRAIFALSINPAPEAVDSLIDEARHDSSSHLRGQALFWLAHKAGAKAAGAITSAAENDPETEVKKKAVFALTQLPPSEGIPLLIKVAETNRNPEVRKQAFFWLGQSHDTRALDFIARVLTN